MLSMLLTIGLTAMKHFEYYSLLKNMFIVSSHF